MVVLLQQDHHFFGNVPCWESPDGGGVKLTISGHLQGEFSESERSTSRFKSPPRIT